MPSPDAHAHGRRGAVTGSIRDYGLGVQTILCYFGGEVYAVSLHLVGTALIKKHFVFPTG